MNPDVSRRVAAAIPRMDDLTLPDRHIIARHVDEADSFESLPEWLRARVLRAERSATSWRAAPR